MSDEAAAPVVQKLLNTFNETSGMMTSLQDNPEMATAMFRYMPIRALLNFGRGGITDAKLQGLLDEVNKAVQA